MDRNLTFEKPCFYSVNFHVFRLYLKEVDFIFYICNKLKEHLLMKLNDKYKILSDKHYRLQRKKGDLLRKKELP